MKTKSVMTEVLFLFHLNAKWCKIIAKLDGFSSQELRNTSKSWIKFYRINTINKLRKIVRKTFNTKIVNGIAGKVTTKENQTFQINPTFRQYIWTFSRQYR